MKKKLLSAVVLCALGFAGCGDDTDDTPPGPVVPKFDTESNIRTWLDSKKLLMEGANIPSFPNGLDEDINYGSASQCYTKVEMVVANNNFQVTSTLGTLKNAPNVGNKGECDHATPNGSPLSFTSTVSLIENVKADASCFDITITYTGFKQVGRGSLGADGKTLSLELFFEGAASGANCAAGAVGSGGITLKSGAAFTGNAVQVYTVSAQ
jgi:hypothetical protein